MLITFYSTRQKLSDSVYERSARRIHGKLTVAPGDENKLQQLQDQGHIHTAKKPDETLVDFGLNPVALGDEVHLVLSPIQLCYYEDLDDLLELSADEPAVYYVHALIKEISRGSDEAGDEIRDYRQMQKAKDFLRMTADLNEGHRVTFFAPEKLGIPLRCKAADLRDIPEITKLSGELAEGTLERDQRIVLFKASLRDHLRMHAEEDRFGYFLKNLSTIYDGYRRDFELWLGNTFADIKKSFEDKRLKFVSDLNGILASVQASILALPIAAIIVGDKYDITNPLKNSLLASAVFGVSFVASRVLDNQEHTLDATKKSIDAVKADYEKQQPAGSKEYKTRLEVVETQEQKVRGLLGKFRTVIRTIVVVVVIAWAVSFLIWALPLVKESAAATPGKPAVEPTAAPAEKPPVTPETPTENEPAAVQH